jgi:hypothetical protein
LVSMNDSEQLVKIIGDVFQSNDGSLRKQAEDTLVILRNEKPNQLICAYYDILKGHGAVIPA